MRRRASVLRWLAVAALAFASRCAAGENGPPAADGAPEPFAVVVDAEAVRFTVQLRSDQEVVDYQLYELGEARKLLLAAAERNGKLTTALQTPTPRFEDTSRFNISSGRDYSSAATAVELFYPIREGFNYIACAREVNTLVKGIAIPEKARFHYVVEGMTLWVADPEKNRPALLKRFADGLQAISAALGGKVKFDVSGLVAPIQERPVGDTRVELSLTPTVTMEVF